jgi:hypothetical protein
MKVFISWSGNTSKTVAHFLREWIPYIIQSVEPWMSATDIDAGARWSRTVETELSDTRFGIICLTRTNTTAPWVLFETGALAKTISETFVCPYLIDLEPSDIPPGPLTQFQAKRATEKETWDLLLTINKALGSDALPEDQLKKTFEKWWPDLKDVIDNLSPEATNENPARSSESKLDEILETVRDLSRRTRSGIRFPRRSSFTEDLRAGLEALKSQEIAIGKKIEEYEALTDKSEFTIEVYYDSPKDRYFAELTAFPAELPVVQEGQPYPVLRPTEPITIGSADKDYLIDLLKSIIVEVGGPITNFALKDPSSPDPGRLISRGTF